MDDILIVIRMVGVKVLKVCLQFCFCICFVILLSCLFVCIFFFCQDVGEGWWEGISLDGLRGLFFEVYVEVKLNFGEFCVF